ncbi:MAG: VOC family protein [Gammaproteobacteria bacterium]|nr:VOC family protein [Gammaproteobacteria bacterium]
MKNFTKINHLALLISDLEKGREFYGKILGLEEIERPSYHIQGIWYQLGDSQLHLMLLEDLKQPQCHPENVTVQPHFAFSVSVGDYQEIIGKLSLSEINVVEESRDLRPDTWQAFFYDYDGNMIEIIATQKQHENV